MDRVVAIIPAREGSKGILNKNFFLLRGKPLIEYSVRAAKSSRFIQNIIITTDSDEIAAYGATRNCHIVHRPKELANDLSPMYDGVRHCLEKVFNPSNMPDLFVLLQPTSPLREDSVIDTCLKKFDMKQYDSLMGVSEMSPKAIRIENNRVVFQYPVGAQRQGLKKAYYDQGHIYIAKTSNVFQKKTLLGENIYPFVCDKITGLDIDTAIDIELAELYFEKYKHRFEEVLNEQS